MHLRRSHLICRLACRVVYRLQSRLRYLLISHWHVLHLFRLCCLVVNHWDVRVLNQQHYPPIYRRMSRLSCRVFVLRAFRRISLRHYRRVNRRACQHADPVVNLWTRLALGRVVFLVASRRRDRWCFLAISRQLCRVCSLSHFRVVYLRYDHHYVRRVCRR